LILRSTDSEKSKIFWVTAPFRFAVFATAFMSFPFFCEILNRLVKVTADEFDIINDQFTPGIGILCVISIISRRCFPRF